MIAWCLASVMLQAAPPAGAPPEASPPAAQADPPKAPAPATPPPSLDEALGIGDGSAPDQPESKIGERLAGASPRDILDSALEDMRRSSQLLDARQGGLPARRAQASVVRKLDELIATAQRMQQDQQQQQQQGSGQSSPRQQRQQGQQSGQEQQEGQQDGEPRPGEGSQRRPGEREAEGEGEGRSRASGDADAQVPPEAIDPSDMTAQLEEGRVEWGRLPPRVRDAVRQGMRDPMSAAYRRLTQEYYRRMAEEPRK